jgi:hypothetical protein
MHTYLPIVAVFAAALSGCAASPWSAGKDAPVSSTAQPSGRPREKSVSPPPAVPLSDAQYQAVMAELAQLGPLDPADQDRLLDDLRQSDPSIWPLVMQQFRSTLVYRRRAADRIAATHAQRLPPVKDEVTQASYAAPAAGDWRQPLVAAMSALEADTPDPTARAAEAQPLLAEAFWKVSAAAPLEIRNPAFCSEVLSFASVKRFDKYEFLQNQEVLLYAEVENFASAPTRQGYHTSLRSNCQIFDGRGTRVAKHAFAATEDYCQRPRRDFFLVYRLRLPKQMTPGPYTLALAVEDATCHKRGEASIEFTVKEGTAPDPKPDTPGDSGSGK